MQTTLFRERLLTSFAAGNDGAWLRLEYGHTQTMRFDSAHGSLDLASLQAAYRAGSLTPAQLIDAIYARMERDALPGVWIHRLEKEAALARARELEQKHDRLRPPLFGIPFAVKDNIDVAGMPTTAACPAFGYVAQTSAPTVQALERAGGLCLGKVNLDQFATGLVGTRSPYGACENVFDPKFVSGGSSSGSAVVVAAHHVTFALGTDTAGSGRVPAALNNVVGLKPSLGLFDSAGVVPACASLDCVSVFALCVSDAVEVRRVVLGQAEAPLVAPKTFSFGIPEPLHPETDALQGDAFASAVEALRGLGGTAVAIDFTPFYELGLMLYGFGVAERYLAVGAFMEANEAAALPVTRDIIMRGKDIDARTTLAALQRIAILRQACQHVLAPLDLLLTPTIARPVSRREDEREPLRANDVLGIYTRFTNYVGCPVLAVPAGFRRDGLPFGVSLIGKPGEDARLDALAALLHVKSGAGMGKSRHTLTPPAVAVDNGTTFARVAVVGAHMRGLALNSQLLELGASFCETTRSAQRYRLFVLPGTSPERPGLVQVASGGASIELEIWQMPWSALGQLMARVPAPLAIGTLELESGEQVKGFLCESYASAGARDISELGGYRYYLAECQKRA
jgi:allophanate hydrolase